jgi:hypothetical protein
VDGMWNDGKEGCCFVERRVGFGDHAGDCLTGGVSLYAMTFLYGQRHRRDIEAAKRSCGGRGGRRNTGS